MRILMVLERDFPPDDRVEKEALSLIQAGHEVHLACFSFNNKPKIEKTKNIVIHRKRISHLTYKSSVGALRFPRYFSFWWNFLFTLCKQFSFDAVHIHDLPLAKIGHKLKQKFGIKYVLDLHENYPASLQEATHTKKPIAKMLYSDKQWRNYEREMVKIPDNIITVVEEMKNRVAAHGLSKNKIAVVENSSHLETFILPDKMPDPKYITLFFAGNINIHRGLQTVINGLPILVDKYKNLRLWIVGAGSYEQTLKDLTRSLHLEKYVSFMGWKNHLEMAGLLMQSNIALIPHLKSEQTDNSSPNKFYQYAYAQKAIVCSNCMSLERMINEFENGVIYEHNSPEAFANAVIYIIESDKYNNIGKKGIELIKSKYNWEVSVQELLNIYE